MNPTFRTIRVSGTGGASGQQGDLTQQRLTMHRIKLTPRPAARMMMMPLEMSPTYLEKMLPILFHWSVKADCADDETVPMTLLVTLKRLAVKSLLN